MWNQILSNLYGQCWFSNIKRKSQSPLIRSMTQIHNHPQIGSLFQSDKFRWVVKNGRTIFFWEDWWLGERQLNKDFCRLYSKATKKFIAVKDFIQLWNMGSVTSLIDTTRLDAEGEKELALLRNILSGIVLSDVKDILVWMPSNGSFSSKACHAAIVPTEIVDNSQGFIWSLIWKLKVPPKIMAFLWKIQWNVIPTKMFLNKRFSGVSPIYPWCSTEVETMTHLFWDCQLPRWG